MTPLHSITITTSIHINIHFIKELKFFIPAFSLSENILRSVHDKSLKKTAIESWYLLFASKILSRQRHLFSIFN